MKCFILGGIALAINLGTNGFASVDLSPFVGTWQGTCQNFSPGSPSPGRTFQVERRVAATSDPRRYQWHTSSIFDGNRIEKPYDVIIVDSERGTLAIDEGSGVFVAAHVLAHSSIWSVFDVADTRLLVRDQLTGDQWTYDIITTPAQPLIGSSNVQNFSVQSLQRCTMDRVAAGPAAS